LSLHDEISRLEEEIERNRTLLSDQELGILASEEIKRLEEQKRSLEQLLLHQSPITPSAPLRSSTPRLKLEEAGNHQSPAFFLLSRPATMEIRPGTGGDEAKIWADDLMRIYLRFC
jgi:protein subunit release factor A